MGEETRIGSNLAIALRILYECSGRETSLFRMSE